MFSYSKKKEEKLKEKLEKQQSNSIPIPIEPQMNYLNKRKNSINKIAIWLQTKYDDNSLVCQGKLFYEEESPGDGLLVHCYNNPNFLGEAVGNRDEYIDFDILLYME